MSYKYSELNNLYRQVSINAQYRCTSRSGDSSSNIDMIDLYACSPSPEQILIQREEESTSAARALLITKQYFKIVFNTVELKFIKGLLTTEETPVQIAKCLHSNFNSLSNSIYKKFNMTSKRLVRLFYKDGYYCLSNLDFLPKLRTYIKNRINQNLFEIQNYEKRKKYKREQYIKHRKLKTEEEIISARNAKRETKLANLPPEEREKQRKVWERYDRFYAKKKKQAE